MSEPAETDEPDLEAHGRPMWSGTLSFGLVSVPVALLPGVRHNRIALRLLGDTGAPVRRHYACSLEEKEISAKEIVKGYPVKPDKYVVVTDAELERLAPERSRDIDLRRFVDVAAIDPMFFDRPYWLTPGGGSTKAYRLLAQTMEETRRAGIATFVMRGKEYLTAIIAQDGLLRAEVLRFADEIRTAEEVGLPKRKAAGRLAVAKVARAMRNLRASRIDPADLVDERNRRLVMLIAKKDREGLDVVTERGRTAEGDRVVIDLMERLKRSLVNRKAPKRHGRKRAA